MHKVDLPPEILERARAMRGGRERIFGKIDPARTAHVVVDLQNGFMREGAPVEVPLAKEVVGNVNAISAALRAAGGHVIYLRYTYDADEPNPWDAWFQATMGKEDLAKISKGFVKGAPDHDLWPELEVLEGDKIVDKTRFSGLVPGTSTLDQALKDLDIQTVIITGTLTNCCCESTARDAQQRNYRVIFVTDGNATHTDFEHNATLASMATIFADIPSTEELLATIEASRQAVAAE